MTDTSGFYALLGGELYHAPNFVSGPDFELHRDNMDDRLNGAGPWKWFDTREEAEAWAALQEEETEDV